MLWHAGEPTHPVEESRLCTKSQQVVSTVSARDLRPHDHLKLETSVKCLGKNNPWAGTVLPDPDCWIHRAHFHADPWS